MRISDWSSDVCSSDLEAVSVAVGIEGEGKSAAPAQRIGNEGNRRPAGGAERALTLDQLAAAEAARRQHEIEDPLQGLEQRGKGMGAVQHRRSSPGGRSPSNARQKESGRRRARGGRGEGLWQSADWLIEM